jgi:VCBS repeat protein
MWIRSAPRSTFTEAAELYEGFITGDFSRDGKLDLIGFWTFSGKNYLGIFLGNGDGTFQPAVQITSNVNAVAAGDFNPDGKLDLAVIKLHVRGDTGGQRRRHICIPGHNIGAVP